MRFRKQAPKTRDPSRLCCAVLAALMLGMPTSPAQAGRDAPRDQRYERTSVSQQHPSATLVQPPPEDPPNPLFRSLAMGADTELGGTNEVTIAVNPNDPMNIACASLVELRVSTDGGATWQPPVFADAPPTHYAGWDPSLAFDGQGRLFWAYLGGIFEEGDLTSIGKDILLAQCDPSTGTILGGYPVNASAAAGFPGSRRE